MVGGLPARLPNGANIGQICLVVRDIDRAMAQWNRLGIGPWELHEFGPNMVQGMTYRGTPQTEGVKLALAQSGPIQFELIETGSEPNVYSEHLERHGEGLHHIGYVVDDMDAAIAEMAALGYPVIQSGHSMGADDDGSYAYFDTEADLGCILEAILPPRRMPEPARWVR